MPGGTSRVHVMSGVGEAEYRLCPVEGKQSTRYAWWDKQSTCYVRCRGSRVQVMPGRGKAEYTLCLVGQAEYMLCPV